MNNGVEGRDSHERHEPYAWHEPTRPETDDPKHSHAGNETVNHHLDDQGPDGLDSDELALRRMLHQAVREMEPRDGTLNHLRRAVPARRARKRQAAVGMAAAALFVGTAVPAVLHVSAAGGSDANPAIAGQASQAQGGTSQGKGPDGTTGGKVGDSSGKTDEQGRSGSTETGESKGTGSTGASSGSESSTSTAQAAPACTASQLGSATANVAGADSAGIVYGTFRVANVSATACTVVGAVTLTPTAQGAADPTKITVVQHASGDAAAGLPDPSLYVTGYALAPGSAYEVKFAWQPTETCPTTSGTGGSTGGESSPSPSPSEQTGTTGDTSAGATTQLFTEDGTADGSVVVTYTADDGATTVSATVPNACAGTIYRTGVLAPS